MKFWEIEEVLVRFVKNTGKIRKFNEIEEILERFVKKIEKIIGRVWDIFDKNMKMFLKMKIFGSCMATELLELWMFFDNRIRCS